MEECRSKQKDSKIWNYDMKTYKCVFSCESPLNTIPDAQKIFGALCRIIYDVKGDLQLQRYLQSLKSEDPIMIHSSMFPNHLLPMAKKNLFGLDYVYSAISATENKRKLSEFSTIKKYKRISYVTESLYQKYIEKNQLDRLKQDILKGDKQITVDDGILHEKGKGIYRSGQSVLMTRNGFPKEGVEEKSLFYSKIIYFPPGTEFCIYVKTNKNKEDITALDRYLEYYGIGSRRTVGMNVFKLQRVEDCALHSEGSYKMMLSKFIPYIDEVDLKESYYTVENSLYRSSKEYGDHRIVGRFAHMTEGSFMKVNKEKEYYGKMIQDNVDGKEIYHYAIGFVL